MRFWEKKKWVFPIVIREKDTDDAGSEATWLKWEEK